MPYSGGPSYPSNAPAGAPSGTSYVNYTTGAPGGYAPSPASTWSSIMTAIANLFGGGGSAVSGGGTPSSLGTAAAPSAAPAQPPPSSFAGSMQAIAEDRATRAAEANKAPTITAPAAPLTVPSVNAQPDYASALDKVAAPADVTSVPSSRFDEAGPPAAPAAPLGAETEAAYGASKAGERLAGGAPAAAAPGATVSGTKAVTTGVSPALQAVVARAEQLSPVPIGVLPTGGVRTPEQQHALVGAGWSKTEASKHLGGNALDVVPVINGVAAADDQEAAAAVNAAMNQAAKELGVDMSWGGNNKTFVDTPHYQVTPETTRTFEAPAKYDPLSGKLLPNPSALPPARVPFTPDMEAELAGVGYPGMKAGGPVPPADIGVGTIADQIIAVESRGDPSAKNPKSTATGLGQFIKGTWDHMIDAYRPDLREGRTAQQVYDLRNDPVISREMVGHYVDENSAILAAPGNNLPVNAGTIYLAHFLGPQTAVAVLKANPSTPIAGLVGPDVMRANPQLRGKTAGQTAEWATQFVGRGAAAAPDPFANAQPYPGLAPVQPADTMAAIAAKHGAGAAPAAAPGASGGQVRDLQTQLLAAGFNPGAIDGVAGPQTRAALVAFQRSQGLRPDARPGPRTQAALGGANRFAEATPPANLTPFPPAQFPEEETSPGVVAGNLGISPREDFAATLDGIAAAAGVPMPRLSPRDSVPLPPPRPASGSQVSTPPGPPQPTAPPLAGGAAAVDPAAIRANIEAATAGAPAAPSGYMPTPAPPPPAAALPSPPRASIPGAGSIVRGREPIGLPPAIAGPPNAPREQPFVSNPAAIRANIEAATAAAPAAAPSGYQPTPAGPSGANMTPSTRAYPDPAALHARETELRSDRAQREIFKQPPEAIFRSMSSLPPEQRVAARGDVVGSVMEAVKAQGPDIVAHIEASPQASRQLAAALGPQGANKFITMLRAEAAGPDLARRFVAAAPAARVDRRVAEHVGRLLASDDPDEFARGVQLVAANKPLSGLLRQVA